MEAKVKNDTLLSKLAKLKKDKMELCKSQKTFEQRLESVKNTLDNKN